MSTQIRSNSLIAYAGYMAECHANCGQVSLQCGGGIRSDWF